MLGITLLALPVLMAIQQFCGKVTNAWWIAGMAAAFAVVMLMIRNGLDITWQSALYSATRIFLWAEFLAALEWQIQAYYFPMDRVRVLTLGLLLCIPCYLAGFAGMYLLERRNQKSLGDDSEGINATGRQALTALLMGLVMFSLSNLSYISVNTPFTGVGLSNIFQIRTIVDLAGVFILESFHLQKTENDRIREMNAIQNILRMQYMQFRQSQDNIDLINRKYHDLKHQLQILRAENDAGRRAQYLDDIESGIRRYESQFKTGNSVLDTILTMKGEQCQKLGIQMTVVSDGSLLQSVAVMDLCTIFGNALDNAIEYEAQIARKEARMIHVTVSEKNNFTLIVIENYFDGKDIPVGRDGLLETTKKDKGYHGYGLKSIRYSVQKYHGVFRAGIRDHWFRVEMLLPQGKAGQNGDRDEHD